LVNSDGTRFLQTGIVKAEIAEMLWLFVLAMSDADGSRTHKAARTPTKSSKNMELPVSMR
jgi:hypothetical protein